MEKVQIALDEFKEAASCYAYLRQVVIQPCSHEKITWDMLESSLLGVAATACPHP